MNFALKKENKPWSLSPGLALKEIIPAHPSGLIPRSRGSRGVALCVYNYMPPLPHLGISKFFYQISRNDGKHFPFPLKVKSEANCDVFIKKAILGAFF